jgi:hypothetical protein
MRLPIFWARWLVFVIVLLVGTPAAFAQSAGGVGACFVASGAKYGIDPRLLWAIAETESSGRADARNLSHLSRTGTIDIGLMQINSSWLPTLARFGITRDRLLDNPCLNIDVGAWILARTIRQQGASWDAVGAYNTACTQLKGDACTASRQEYVRKVWSWYQGTPPPRQASVRRHSQPNSGPRQPAGAAPDSDIVFTTEDGTE